MYGLALFHSSWGANTVIHPTPNIAGHVKLFLQSKDAIGPMSMGIAAGSTGTKSSINKEVSTAPPIYHATGVGEDDSRVTERS